MKALRLALTAALTAGAALLGSGCGAAESPEFVYRKGNRLYLDGEPYRFKGLNIWWANNRRLVGCGPITDAASLGRSLDAIGSAANAVRAWFFQTQVTVNGVRDWSGFDETLHELASRDMKVVAVLADELGSCGDPPFRSMKDFGWYQSGYASTIYPGSLQTYRDYVRDVVRRYRNSPEILAWQLINEAAPITPGVGCTDEAAAAATLRGWVDDMAGLIRSIDPNHLISLGTGLANSCGQQITSDPFNNNNYAYVHASPNVDLCEYHDYFAPADPLFVLQRWQMDACRALGKAFFVGETGIPHTDPNRPNEFKAKLDAQFGYANEPAQGVLIWAWGTAQECDQYCVRAGDPVLDVLRDY